MTERTDEEEPTRTDSQDDSIPEGSVPLHRLCDRCRQMFDTWDKTCQWFGRTEGLERSRGYERYELCTLTDMMKSRQSCHLCEMLYSQIKHHDRIPLHEPIVCQIGLPSLWISPGKHSTLKMSLLSNDNVLSSDCLVIHHSVGGLGNPNDKYRFEFPFMTKHIPRQPTDNLAQMQRWLCNCRAKHYICNNWYPRLNSKGYRPTRILELNENGARLRCDPQNIGNFEYLALSHMWGEDHSTRLLLTTSTLQEFQEAVPMHRLSSIFNEAIRITRGLGFSYLWLDSLCIIQDSTIDWTNEASMMSAVYNNAVCTIAFLFPPDMGFCQFRDDPRASTPCVVRGVPWDWGGLYIVPKEERKSNFLTSDWPLSSRAWVLQEQLLSPRTILYGHRTIMWECGTEYHDELAFCEVDSSRVTWKNNLYMRRCQPNQTTQSTSIDARLERKVEILLLLLLRLFQPFLISIFEYAGYPFSTKWKNAEIHGAFPDWARLIREYRRRNLSHASDRLMAIVGIARAFQSDHGFTYLAGTWKEHLPRSLLWYIETARVRKMAEPFLIREPPSKSVPTWSWFAGPIYMYYDVVIPGGGSRSWDPQLYVAKFLHFRWPKEPVNHAPPTAYYDFEGLRITLECATHMTTILSQEPNGKNDCPRLRCDSLEQELACCLGFGRESLAASYHCDDLETLYQPPAKVRIALIAEEVDLNYRHDLQGLALEPGVESDTWKRIGYWKAWVDLGDDTCEAESIFLRLEGVKIETLTLV